MGNYSVDLCPKVNRGAFIRKTVVGLPETKGYEIPLMPITCELVPEEGWYIPIMPSGGCPFPLQDIRWSQEEGRINTAFGPSLIPHNYWRFSIVPPRGLFEGTCAKCFPRSSPIYLIGSLGFDGGTQVSQGDKVFWRVHRSDLPFPGESIIAAVACADGEGDALLMRGRCVPPQCDTPSGDCIWGRVVSLATSGTYLVLGGTHFATPTWTGGVLVDYFTQSAGWAGVPAGNHVFPSCDVYGDPTLQYKIKVEGVYRNVTPVGFAGYGIGTHVLLKKLGRKYNEPFSDSCLGASEGAEGVYVEREKIGLSDGTFSPPLSTLSQLPIDLSAPITIFTNYSVLSGGVYMQRSLSVSVSLEDGSCSGDCSVGNLDLRKGTWEDQIIWTHIPDGWWEEEGCEVEIMASYSKAEEPCTDVAIVPWHVMGMGG